MSLCAPGRNPAIKAHARFLWPLVALCLDAVGGPYASDLGGLLQPRLVRAVERAPGDGERAFGPHLRALGNVLAGVAPPATLGSTRLLWECKLRPMFHAAPALRVDPSFTALRALVEQPRVTRWLANAVRQEGCSWCGELSRGLKKCGGCRRVRFCSRRCQKLDWRFARHPCPGRT